MKRTSIVLACLCQLCHAAAPVAVPNTVPHQGRIAVDGVNFDGLGRFKFEIYAATQVAGEPAVGQAIIGELGGVEAVEVVEGGSGYLEAPAAKLPNGNEEGHGLAQFDCVVAGGSVVAVQVLDPGALYPLGEGPLELVIDPPGGLVAGERRLWAHDGTPAGGPVSYMEVPVERGLYSVQLGGAGMEPLPEDLAPAEEGEQLFLRIWFDDGVNGFAALAPDTPLSSLPFALSARRAAQADFAEVAGAMQPGSITTEMLADGAITRDKLGGAPAVSGDRALPQPSGGTLQVTFDEPFGQVPTISLPDGEDYPVSNVTTTGFEVEMPVSFEVEPFAGHALGVDSVVLQGGAIGLLIRTSGGLRFVRALDAAGTAWSPPVTVAPTPPGEMVGLGDYGGSPGFFYRAGGVVTFYRAADPSGSVWNAPVTVLSLDSAFFDSIMDPRNDERIGGIAVAKIAGAPAVALWAAARLEIGGQGGWVARIAYRRAVGSTGALWGAVSATGTFSAGDAARDAVALTDFGGQPCLGFTIATKHTSAWDPSGYYTFDSHVALGADANAASWSAPVAGGIGGGELDDDSGFLAAFLDSEHFEKFYFSRTLLPGISGWGDWTQVAYGTNEIGDLAAREFTLDLSGPVPAVLGLGWGEGELQAWRWQANDAAGQNWAAPVPEPVPAVRALGGDFILGGRIFERIGSHPLRYRSGPEIAPSLRWIAASPDGGGVFGEGTLGGGEELEMVFGRYNVQVPDAAVVVGNGASDGARSNALVVTTAGDLYVGNDAYKPGGGSFLNSSDARLKKVEDERFGEGLDAIANLKPVRYRYRRDNPLGLPSDRAYVGVLAQELEAVLPEAVSYDRSGYRLVNNDVVLWTMLNAVNELRAENESLRARVGQLEAAR